jgi:hypothetical protein
MKLPMRTMGRWSSGKMTRQETFLMNLMMASGGFPWTIVRTARRKQYLDALEVASADQNIIPFAKEHWNTRARESR